MFGLIFIGFRTLLQEMDFILNVFDYLEEAIVFFMLYSNMT